MTKQQSTDLARAVSCCRALSDETRLRIIHMLVGGERCVCELAEELKIRQPLLSFHLKTLKEAGLVRVRRDGRWMHYTLDPDGLEQVGSLLSRLATDHREAGVPLRTCC
ncbi:MAG: metalloregulator ArsR/SmtB family transcription factor [Gemmatimonadales bacterium]|nr:metalloregulator ArsR/SmtB family transcription factor [Gemmatimonadales bacterium]NIN50021.1 metalloregulator ArsR/SmtB family transcription factor [Gemmatimonadales bacterium]NIP07485.1 metalloregulator ArsR/SmtB family transcription factor [Gemmatimonadales bacterium]NIR03124.1 metalloregulator ArsR/SmtB family transcription factor [Gemmatimonadales bacterium]NIS66836.1 metalloregulator ArsR/SmtB family transcription factor [Gemmatimonadales bacterium]